MNPFRRKARNERGGQSEIASAEVETFKKLRKERAHKLKLPEAPAMPLKHHLAPCAEHLVLQLAVLKSPQLLTNPIL